MKDKRDDYKVVPFPRSRRSALDAGRLGRRKHIIHGLIEVDVTEVRRRYQEHEAKTGERLSFTAFIVNCLGRALEVNESLHAYLNWRNQLVIFKDVNVSIMVEVDMAGQKLPMPHIIKAVNRRTFREIHEEIRAVQAHPDQSQGSEYLRWFLRLPAFVRRVFAWIVLRVPQLLRQYSAPVMVTAVGMFGSGGGWGIPAPSFTLTVTLGGIAQKPGVVDGRIRVREYLCVTLSFDHDIIDGAPAARFTQRFKELIETGYGLSNLDLNERPVMHGAEKEE
jgi:hypothetical protein